MQGYVKKAYQLRLQFMYLINSVLTYACETTTLSKACKNRLNKIQAKLFKCIVGLSPNYRTTPLFNALKVHPASNIIDMNNIRLLHNIMSNSSAAIGDSISLSSESKQVQTLCCQGLGKSVSQKT